MIALRIFGKITTLRLERKMERLRKVYLLIKKIKMLNNLMFRYFAYVAQATLFPLELPHKNFTEDSHLLLPGQLQVHIVLKVT